MTKLKKMIVLSFTLCSMLGMAQNLFAAETTIGTEKSFILPISLTPTNTFFPNKEQLNKMHQQMVTNMMEEVVRTKPSTGTKKRVTRSVLSDTGEQWNTARNEDEFTNDALYNGILFNSTEFHLVTRFKVFSRHAEIISTSTGGTFLDYGIDSVSENHSIIKNNSRSVVSQAQFTVSSDGLAGTRTRTFSITTTITVKYSGDGVINFVARSIVDG